jgi:formate--tetrahydrofolate ligase
LGPFANIAHGCNSIVATQTALAMGKFCVTEAGFGSDLGAEKFLNIKTRLINKVPDIVVLVVTIKATKEQGQGDLVAGVENIKKHIQNIKEVFGLNLVVAINKHNDDSVEDLNLLTTLLNNEKVENCVCAPFTKGADGCVELAKKVEVISKQQNHFKHTYNLDDSIKEKIEKVATRVYGATKIEFADLALKKLKILEKLNDKEFFINIAKTQFSFSDDKNKLGAPKDFTFHVSDIEIRSGANMVVVIAGSMLLMPGLGKNSNYLNMHINNEGKIDGLF